jgi:uracil-DNA glycosylase
MIVGAYPTAHFHSIDGINDVPVEDHLYPFSNECYYDGCQVRRVRSGEELEEFYLKKLGYPREKCWITDLVKVFLFKEGHIEKYRQLKDKHQDFSTFCANRKSFVKLAGSEANLDYLYREISLAQPKAILLLGEEVTSVVLKKSRTEANQILQKGLQDFEIDDKKYKVLASAHPGILMRGGEAGKKWRRITEGQINELKYYLSGYQANGIKTEPTFSTAET